MRDGQAEDTDCTEDSPAHASLLVDEGGGGGGVRVRESCPTSN